MFWFEKTIFSGLYGQKINTLYEKWFRAIGVSAQKMARTASFKKIKKSKHMHAVLTKMSLITRGPSKFWCKTSHETPNYSVYVYTLDCMYVCMYTLYTLYTVCMYVCIHYILYVCTYMPVERFLVRTPHSAAMEEFIAEAAYWFYGQ